MALPTFSSGPQVCGDLGAGGRREWLVADGWGGYAMGTASGLRTRRYHGLLVVSGLEPAGRMMALAALDAVLTLPSGARIRLATHEWAGGPVDPRGHELLSSFEVRDGLPRWVWRAGDVLLERTLAVRHASLAVVHTLLAGGPVELLLEPLCTWRDAHGERRAGGDLTVDPVADGAVVAGAYRITGPGFEHDPQWYLGAYHREEAARGLTPSEDLLRLGRFRAALEPGDHLEVTAWAGDADRLATAPPPARDAVAAARHRARTVAGASTSASADPDRAALVLAADAFVVERAGAADVVAGYPWFGVWSRDTMTSYEGLFLSTGRIGEGRGLLRAYAGTVSAGMLANTADTGRPEHNTADAALWFLHAVDRHVAATGDTDLAAELIGPLEDVVRHHRAGTRYGIAVDPADGLLTQGAPGYALTWMDAVTGGVAVTPRAGKAVELNALWINGLAALAGLRERLGRDGDDLRAARERAVAAFRRRFPAPTGWLYDVLDTGPELRPNQLLAYSLPYAPLRGGDPAPLGHAARHLLTPLGPRTLAPDDPAYTGRHRGDPHTRDRAYHQGTVWPWLLGPFADAARAVGRPTPGLLDGVLAHLPEWGVGSVSETAEGDPPHEATGCPFQAWSVAEVLRLHVAGTGEIDAG
jgi:predicted glycogen debranching enzyme